MHAATAPRLSPDVHAFLERGPLRLFIGGQWIAARTEQTVDVIDPGAGTPLCKIQNAGPEDVDAAVTAARKAFRESGWAQMKPNERGVYLHRLADLIEKQRDTIAEIESLDVGKPSPQARGDVMHFVLTLRYYADLARHVSYREPIPVPKHEARTVRHPWGVCGFILPWNFPFLLVGWNISPALAAGNTVVVKPPEDAPLSTLYLADLVREAGIPDGVFNVVTGLGETTGAAMSSHPGLARMGFTGSPEVGRMVASACGQNLVPVKLELGGKGAAVVFEDADVSATADALTRAITLNTGQVCCTATRWLVHDSIYDDFAEWAVERMRKIRVGYWNDPGTEMGPLISKKQMDRVCGYLRRGVEEGAKFVLDGGPAHVPNRNGFYVKPAVLTGPEDNVAARDEIFGPVAYVMKFSNEEQAVEMVNSSPYGLANSVWSRDLVRANRVAEALVAGNSWINAHNVFVHGVPYAGVNRSGMGGGVLGPATLFDYMREQSVVMPV